MVPPEGGTLIRELFMTVKCETQRFSKTDDRKTLRIDYIHLTGRNHI